jgi:hypothetical protein
VPVGNCPLGLRTRQKHDGHRGDADDPDHKHIVSIGDESEPTQGVAHVGLGAVRATDGELARSSRAGPLPAEQGIRKLLQRRAYKVELGVKLAIAVRARFHAEARRAKD